MPKPEWGVKRTCPNCETRFYDLQNEPIVCPECGTTYDVDSHGKVSATRERRAVPAAADEDVVDDEDLVEDEDEDGDEDEPLLADEDEDAEPASPALSDEDEEEEEAPFKGTAIIDEDEDDDEDDVDLDEDDDEDDDLDLDEIPEKP